MIKSPENFFEKVKKKFDKTDRNIVITTFVLGLITNFYFLIRDGLAPDALSADYLHIAGPWEIQLGRFSLQILDNVRFGFVNQLIIILLSLLFMSGFIMLIRRIFKIKSNILLFLLTSIVVVAPQFTETYMFLYCADSYLLAFFTSALAVFSLSKIESIKTSKRWIFLAFISTILISSLYQAYLGVLLGLVVIYAIYEVFEKGTKTALKHFVRNAIIIFIGICAYYVAFRAFCKLYHVRPSSYKGADGLGLSTLRALPDTIKVAFTDFYNFFFAESGIINNAYYHRGLIYIGLAIAGILALFKNFKSEKKERVGKIFTVLLLLAVFPIAVNIMNLIATGTRINLVTGPGILMTVVLFIILIDRLKEGSFENLIRWASIILLVVLGWTYLISNVHTYVARSNQYNEFKTISENIYEKATALNDYKKDMPFLFSNAIVTPAEEFEKTNGMVTGNTISWLGYAGIERYTLFFEKYLGIKIKAADKDQYKAIIETDEFKEMEIYPENESVKIIDGVVVVKISNEVLIDKAGEVIEW